jgi:hypothetical protein
VFLSLIWSRLCWNPCQNQLQDSGTIVYQSEVELGDKTSLEAYVNGVSVFYGFGMEQVKFFKAEVAAVFPAQFVAPKPFEVTL